MAVTGRFECEVWDDACGGRREEGGTRSKDVLHLPEEARLALQGGVVEGLQALLPQARLDAAARGQESTWDQVTPTR